MNVGGSAFIWGVSFVRCHFKKHDDSHAVVLKTCFANSMVYAKYVPTGGRTSQRFENKHMRHLVCCIGETVPPVSNDNWLCSKGDENNSAPTPGFVVACDTVNVLCNEN
eukprot:2248557-Amphidinium_carterae.1